MKLHNYYSIDECNDETALYKKLDGFVKDNKIEYSQEDKYLIKIVDVDLTEQEEEQLAKFLDSLEVYPFMDYEEDEEEYPNYDPEYDDMDFNDRRKSSKYEDDF